MNQVLKLFLKIIYEQIYSKLGNTQFQNSFRTTEELFTIQTLVQKWHDATINIGGHYTEEIQILRKVRQNVFHPRYCSTST